MVEYWCGSVSSSKKNPNLTIKNLKNPYLGKKYSNDNVEKVLKNFSSKINYQKFDDNDKLNSFVCNKLLNEKIIGWFQGKMEFWTQSTR